MALNIDVGHSVFLIVGRRGYIDSRRFDQLGVAVAEKLCQGDAVALGEEFDPRQQAALAMTGQDSPKRCRTCGKAIALSCRGSIALGAPCAP